MAAREGAPIFVVGFRRSGTTLLQALLGAHPRIAAPPEMRYFSRIPALGDYFGDLADDAVLRRVIDATVNPPLPASLVFADCGWEVDRIFERARTMPRTYASVLDAVMMDFAERQGKVRWCEKTPTQHAAVIWAHFPAAKVVHIVRDPRASVASTLEMPSPWPNAKVVAEACRGFILRNVVEGAARGPAQYLRISYEALTGDPEIVLRQVFTFLEEDFDPAVLTDLQRRSPTVSPLAGPWQGRALEAVKPPTPGAWRERMAPVDRIRTAAVLAGMLEPLGYEEPRRATVLAGRLVNAALAPAEWARGLPGRLRARRPMTPQQRYEANQRLQTERAEAYGARLRQMAEERPAS